MEERERRGWLEVGDGLDRWGPPISGSEIERKVGTT
jgi:hypothetical protein